MVVRLHLTHISFLWACKPCYTDSVQYYCKTLHTHYHRVIKSQNNVKNNENCQISETKCENDWIIRQSLIKAHKVDPINKEQLAFLWCRGNTVFYISGWICTIFSWPPPPLSTIWALQGVKLAGLMNSDHAQDLMICFMITEFYFMGCTNMNRIQVKAYVNRISDSELK